jgi:hypothetical protein
VPDACVDEVDDARVAGARVDAAGVDGRVDLREVPTLDRRRFSAVRFSGDGDAVGALVFDAVREFAVCAEATAAASENIEPATGDRLTSAPGAVRGVLDGSAS